MKPVFVFSLMVLASTLACASRGPAAEPVLRGTGDSGGGNLYLGRPLESYIVKPTELPGGKLALRKLGFMLEEDDIHPLRFIFDNVLKEKVWYAVPGPLRKIPAAVIGSAVETEQGALQTMEAVWLDSDLFAVMKEEDQARLILHEVVMGLRLLKFASDYEQCLAGIGQAALLRGVRPAEYCRKFGSQRRGSPSDLTEKDYTQVRLLTNLIMELQSELLQDAALNLVRGRGFDMAMLSFQRYALRGMETIDREVFARIVSDSILSGDQPQYMYRLSTREVRPPVGRTIIKPSGVCAFGKPEKQSDGHYTTTLSWTDSSKASSKSVVLFPPSVLDMHVGKYEVIHYTFDGDSKTKLELRTAPPIVEAGARFFRITVLFGETLKFFEVREYVKLSSGFERPYSGQDAVAFACDTQSQLILEN